MGLYRFRYGLAGLHRAHRKGKFFSPLVFFSNYKKVVLEFSISSFLILLKEFFQLSFFVFELFFFITCVPFLIKFLQILV